MFAYIRSSDPGFSFVVLAEKDNKVKNLMWANGSSRMQYKFFGDVVTFDTTYRTNLYDMPFGLFVGVNNHYQSIILAGVLMRDEQEESFEWRVFRIHSHDGRTCTKNNTNRPMQSNGGCDQENLSKHCPPLVQVACSEEGEGNTGAVLHEKV